MLKIIKTSLTVATLFIMSSSLYASTPSKWAQDDLNKAIEEYVITEELNGNFQEEATRDDFVKLLVQTYERLIGNEIDITDVSNPFLDSNQTYVIKAYHKGFITGTAIGQFNGELPISREEIVVMAIRMNKALEIETGESILNQDEQENLFEDEQDISQWALESVNIACQNNIISGYPDGRFVPKGIITKEQVVIVNYRSYENIKAKVESINTHVNEYIAKQASKVTTVTALTAVEEADKEVPQKGYVTASVLNIRETPDTVNNENIVGKLNRYEQVMIHEMTNEWYQISADYNRKGYVHSDYIELVKATNNEITNETPNEGQASEIRAQVVAFAKQHMDLRYVYGGNSLVTGTDCSGFVKLVLKEFGYNINRTASTQAKNGVYIPTDQLLPGDLVFYGSGNISHVAMYIGNGKVIHAGNSRTGVLVSDVFGNWFKPYITSRRIIVDN